MSQGNMPLPRKMRMAAREEAGLAGAGLGVYDKQTQVQDRIFRDIGLASSHVIRGLIHDCLFAQLGKMVQGAGPGSASLTARLILDEPSLQLSDTELRRGIAGLAPVVPLAQAG